MQELGASHARLTAAAPRQQIAPATRRMQINFTRDTWPKVLLKILSTPQPVVRPKVTGMPIEPLGACFPASANTDWKATRQTC